MSIQSIGNHCQSTFSWWEIFNSGELSQMKLRKEPKVVRLHKFKKYSEPHEFYYAQLELYYIFRSEEERRHCEEIENLYLEKMKELDIVVFPKSATNFANTYYPNLMKHYSFKS